MIKKVMFALLLTVVCAGCHSDLYYQNRAVERARKYLLANCDDLSVDQMYFIRYNAPLLLHAPALGNIRRKIDREKLETGLNQVCVTWMIPGKNDLYMVFGVSGARMDDWYPNRLLIRDYSKKTPVLAEPVLAARKYAMNNFFQNMNNVDINTVRFSFPYLIRTKFDLNFDPHGSMSDGEVAELRKKSAGMVQYSLVWKISDGNLVFSGLSEDGLKNWNIMLAEIISDAELKECTEKVVMTPAEGLNELPASEKNIAAKEDK